VTKTVALINYGVGNLTSVERGLRRAGLAPLVLDARQASVSASIADADGILIPGVGHFSATAAITDNWRAALTARVRAGVPILGICLGMQWLFEGSTEAPGTPGLALAQGLCQELNETGTHFAPRGFLPAEEMSPGLITVLKVPHLGWNRVLPVARASRLLAGVEPGAFAYFAHSFAAPVGPDTAATTAHGATFASVIERGNIFGAQFHPELSSDTGAALFRNFARVVNK